MEGKAESHDLNSSLETEDSDEVWFRVILEGTEGSVSGMGGGGRCDPLGSTPRDVPPAPPTGQVTKGHNL